MCMGGHSPPLEYSFVFCKEQLLYLFISSFLRVAFPMTFIWFIKLCFAVICFLIVLHSATANRMYFHLSALFHLSISFSLQ